MAPDTDTPMEIAVNRFTIELDGVKYGFSFAPDLIPDAEVLIRELQHVLAKTIRAHYERIPE